MQSVDSSAGNKNSRTLDAYNKCADTYQSVLLDP